MKTNEIFEHVLQIVCEECELCYGELINEANKNAVDARCLLICALVSLGFSEENTRAILAKLDSIQTQALQDKITALTAEKATLNRFADNGLLNRRMRRKFQRNIRKCK